MSTADQARELSTNAEPMVNSGGPNSNKRTEHNMSSTDPEDISRPPSNKKPRLDAPLVGDQSLHDDTDSLLSKALESKQRVAPGAWAFTGEVPDHLSHGTLSVIKPVYRDTASSPTQSASENALREVGEPSSAPAEKSLGLIEIGDGMPVAADSPSNFPHASNDCDAMPIAATSPSVFPYASNDCDAGQGSDQVSPSQNATLSPASEPHGTPLLQQHFLSLLNADLPKDMKIPANVVATSEIVAAMSSVHQVEGEIARYDHTSMSRYSPSSSLLKVPSPSTIYSPGSTNDRRAAKASARHRSSSDGATEGIFDDADGDDQIQLADFVGSSVEVGQRHAVSSPLASLSVSECLSDDRRSTIRRIVAGSPYKLSTSNAPSLLFSVGAAVQAAYEMEQELSRSNALNASHDCSAIEQIALKRVQGSPRSHDVPSSLPRAIAVGQVADKTERESTRMNAPSASETVDAIEKVTERKEEGMLAKKGVKKALKRKRVLQTRILVSKRDAEQADSLLLDKGDLSECLPSEDCLFLGDKFWIFTVQQLKFVLNTAETSSTTILDQILVELASSFYRQWHDQMPENRLELAVDDKAYVTDERSQASELDQRKGSSHDSSTGYADSHSTRLEAKAEDRILYWKEKVTSFRSKKKVEEQFRLDGAIKVLFPLATLNFLRSIKVETLWNFLAMRKTETGAIAELMGVWRRECLLSPIPDLGIAKHFLGVASRVETALSAVPPVAEEDQTWMNDPINIMTGAARDFLIHYQKISSATEFISMRTKDVSIYLEAWREIKGMPPLKGSGKVAMISAWKTSVKEALEAEAGGGEVIDMSELVENTRAKLGHEKILSLSTMLVPEKEKSLFKLHVVEKEKPKEKHTLGERIVDYSLCSKLFLEDVLGHDVSRLLKSAGIRTAADLFDADTERDESSLYQVLRDVGKVDSLLACTKTVDKWRQALRRGLDQLGKKAAPPSITLNLKLPPSERILVEQNVTDRRSSIPSFSHKPKKLPDPIEILSVLTKEFLETIGINTAVDFLSARSTDVAVQFKNWRIETGKPELKGLGAIASVSGWKAAVRKKATEMGL